MPAPAPDPQPAVGSIVVPGLVAFADWLREALWRLAADDPFDPPWSLDALGAEVEERVARVRTGAEEHGYDLGLLADPTRRALSWLIWLAEPAQRAAHRETLGLLVERAEALRGDVRRPAATRSWAVRVDLYATAAIVRGRGASGVFHVTAAQPFVGAPADVLDALVLAGAGSRDRTYIDLARDHALSEEALETAMALELAVDPPPPRTRGRCHDLEASFRRVNAALFGGRLAPPRLTWSPRPGTRGLGYYQPQGDLIVINLALDDARFRAADVDFVVYHELLHRELGREVAGGRRLYHGPAFRAAERRYPGYAEVARRLGLRGA